MHYLLNLTVPLGFERLIRHLIGQKVVKKQESDSDEDEDAPLSKRKTPARSSHAKKEEVVKDEDDDEDDFEDDDDDEDSKPARRSVRDYCDVHCKSPTNHSLTQHLTIVQHLAF